MGDGERRLLGGSLAWKRVLSLVELAAPTDASVLLLGESGTGKGEVAKLIHRLSPRRRRPFVSVNCAAVPESLFETEFFGHQRGAFTGAVQTREGRFLLADGGTLFLDEVGCLPEAAQSKVLRVVEEGLFERVGDSRSIRVDVRLVSATNTVLDEAVEVGEFRRDLFYRINLITIHMPPLRERQEDIPMLTRAFLEEASARTGRPVKPISSEVMSALQRHHWPGNIRELRNVVERAVILEQGPEISPSSIPEAMIATPHTLEHPQYLRDRLRREERKVLVEALEQSNGVRRHAARLLGIDERNFSYYLRKHGLETWQPAGE